MRTPSASARPPRRTPPRSGRASRSRGARRSATSEYLSNWIDTVSGLLNDPDPAMLERGLAELQRGFESEPGPWVQDKREMLAAVVDAASNGALGTQPEIHIALARIRLRQFGDRAGAESSLWYATFGAARLASSNLPAHRERAAMVNRAASRVWGDLGNAYQRDARDAIARQFTSTPADRALGAPVFRSWPDVGRGEWSSHRQPAMGPRQAAVPVPPILKTPNGQSPDLVPPGMDGVPAKTASVLDLLTFLSAHVGLYRRGKALAAYLKRCDAARRSRDFLPTPMRPNDVRQLESFVKSAPSDPSITDEQRAAMQRLGESVDFGFMLEASLAYWGTGR